MCSTGGTRPADAVSAPTFRMIVSGCPFAVHQYISSTHDDSVLDEVIPFIEGPPLPQDQEDAHYVPVVSRTSARPL